MWTIAICDDNERDCDNLEELLEVYCREKNVAMESELFYDGSLLYEKMSLGKRYDLIFLDILMEGMDGIRVGEEIRGKLDNEDVEIVYMSYEVRNAEAVMENRPMKFLRKPFHRKRVFQIADYARKLGFRREQQFSFQKKKVFYQVPYEDILYFQSVGRKVEIHMVRETKEFYGKLSEILARGLPEQFVQIHQSYIVNTDFIVEFTRDWVCLKGEKGYFTISRTYRRAAMLRLKPLIMAEFVR
jgi:DNA-binding LytR/AlgR family response regulator